MNHLKSRPRVKKCYGRGCFSSFALSLPNNPHDYCILFPSAQTLGQVCFRAGLSGYLAPYCASVSDDEVTYKQVDDMTKKHP